MLEIKEKKNCCGCGACANICPKGCITLVEDNEGFLYPQIDSEKCINCGLCEKTCPVNSVKKDSLKIPTTYGCYSKDNEELLKSSSGGIFSLLARYFYKNNGVVYGAAFIDAYNVAHIRTDSEQELDYLRRSKYVQSEIGEIFKSVKKDLTDGKLVLFTGTNCQIAGLKSFLSKEYKNLYTQDIICHGVPSRKVWRKYLKENKISKNANINFRDKTDGWKNYNFLIKEKNEVLKKETFNKNNYMKAFLTDCSLRPACYDCKFKGVDRCSDITLADFWGVEKAYNEIHCNEGTSAVIIHSKKGQELFEKVNEEIRYKEVDFMIVVNDNPSYLFSSKKNKNRENFFNDLDRIKFNKIAKKYCEPTITQKIKKRMKKIINKIRKKT